MEARSALPILNGIQMPNRLMLASGSIGIRASVLASHARFAGAVVTKSISLFPKEGNPKPRIVKISEDAMINSEGLPNPGMHAFVSQIREFKAAVTDRPLIVSVFGYTIDDIIEAAQMAEEAGADAIELNSSCPNVASIRDLETDRGALCNIIGSLRRAIRVPLLIKISTNGGDVVERAVAAEASGADYVVAINSVYPTMEISLQKHAPKLGMVLGGLTGRPIKPIALAAVYRIYQAVKIPIVGTGGVFSGRDALEMIMAGASAVGVYTAASLHGPEIFASILREMEELQGELALPPLEECVGMAHRLD